MTKPPKKLTTGVIFESAAKGGLRGFDWIAEATYFV